MGGLPIFLDIENKNVIVIGGGNASLIKVKKLVDFNCNITILSKGFKRDFIDNVLDLDSSIKIINKKFDSSDIDNFFLVIASADEKTNEFVYDCANKKNILCNVSSNNIKSDFMFPAHIKNGELTIAVSTNGSYPLISKNIARKIYDEFDLYNLSLKIKFLEEKRKYIIDNITDNVLRRKILIEIIGDDILYSNDYIQKVNNILKRYFNG